MATSSNQDPNDPSRRRFIRQSACASLGTIGVVNTIANLKLMSAAMAACTALTDYKALICLYLGGGNDSDNMLIPYSGAERTLYETHRQVVAHPAEDLQRIYPDNSSTEFGLHPNLPGMASMFNGGRMAFLTNVGSLLYPYADRNEFLTGAVPAPPNIFAHNTMTTHWMSSIPDMPFTSGWGGRIADLLHASLNPSSEVSMTVSIDGLSNLLAGAGSGVSQLAINRKSPVKSLSGFGSDYSSALSGTDYLNTEHGARLKALDDINTQVRAHLMEDTRSSAFVDARENEAVISAALSAAASSGVDFDSLFATSGDTSLGQQLKTVAQLMAGRDCMGNNRQIFFVRVGGYDNHGSLLAYHNQLTQELDDGLTDFDQAIQQLGLLSNTLLFSASEFGRTFKPNKTDASAGSDHGWGGHVFMYGGAVKGKNLYGHYPDLTPGGPNESSNTRGRWIPTSAVDQYGAMLTKWLGADSNSLEAIFPNLSRFDNPITSSSANMKFINFAI